MKIKALSLFSELENEFLKLEEQWGALDSKKLIQRPSENSWSPLEAALHLIQSEGQTLQYTQKKIQAGDSLLTVSEEGNERFRQLKMALDSERKFGVPLAQLAPPQELPSVVDALQQWKQIRRAWAAFLQDFPEAYENREVFRHPIAGMLSLEQTMGFFLSHFRHHLRQLLPA